MFYPGKNIISGNLTLRSIKISWTWKGYLTSCRPDPGLNGHVSCHRVYNRQTLRWHSSYICCPYRGTLRAVTLRSLLEFSGLRGHSCSSKCTSRMRVCRCPKRSSTSSSHFYWNKFLIVRSAFKRKNKNKNGDAVIIVKSHCVPGTGLSASYAVFLFYVVLATTLGARYYYHSVFLKKYVECEKTKGVIKVTSRVMLQESDTA